jgi:LmbE family N-acetylglucosaminyl deacetylase
MLAQADIVIADEAEQFLTVLADPSRPRINASHVMIVVAHPDDETIGCGAQLGRMSNAIVLLVTDGAPQDLRDAHNAGFASAAEYAAAREREVLAAVAMAGVPESAVFSLGIPDQWAAFALTALSRCLADLFAGHGTHVVLTHAYEGGHPDHDATAFAVHAAARLLARESRPPGIIEMPFYRQGENGAVRQEFETHSGQREIMLRLDANDQSLKQRMMSAHSTQGQTLTGFSTEIERFRHAPSYDFRKPANNGRLHYERYAWGMTGALWSSLAHRALIELGLRSP